MRCEDKTQEAGIAARIATYSSNFSPRLSATAIPGWHTRAVKQFFDWCEDHRLSLDDIEPIAIAAYIEELSSKIARPSVKPHLAAIRQLLNSIDTGEFIGLRDRALLGLMGYTLARVSILIDRTIVDAES